MRDVERRFSAVQVTEVRQGQSLFSPDHSGGVIVERIQPGRKFARIQVRRYNQITERDGEGGVDKPPSSL